MVREPGVALVLLEEMVDHAQAVVDSLIEMRDAVREQVLTTLYLTEDEAIAEHEAELR